MIDEALVGRVECVLLFDYQSRPELEFAPHTSGRDLDLRYFRDIDRREVDFVAIENRRPTLLIECKLADRDIDIGLRYLKKRFPAARAFQIAVTGQRDFVTPQGIRAMPALDFLRTLV